MNPEIAAAQAARRKALVFPREHGAWGMLLVPLLSGAAVAPVNARTIAAVLLYTVAAVALLWLRTPVESWFGLSVMRAQTKDERTLALRYTAIAGGIAIAAVVALFWGGRNILLLPIGGVAGVAVAAQMTVRSLGRRYRTASQVVGAIGLTSTAAGAYYVAAGRIDRTALVLWIANWLFAAAQIQYVQMQVRYSQTGYPERLRRGRLFLMELAAIPAVVLLAGVFGLLPIAALVAFVPTLVRVTMWCFSGPRQLVLKRVGLTELSHAIVFGVLLIVAFVVR